MQTLPPELKGRKVSETFMAYVEPYLIDIMSDGSIQTSEQIEVALRLPWSVWNAIQFDKKNNNENHKIYGSTHKSNANPRQKNNEIP